MLVPLRSFFDLSNEIILFLEMKDQDVTTLEVQNFPDLAFMVDNTKHLNELNLNLLGKNKMITSMYENVKAFQTKLCLWKCLLLRTCKVPGSIVCPSDWLSCLRFSMVFLSHSRLMPG
jgi:hypothetical protein